ncbi:hypothetical protein OPT61_g6297 [Boeremia exigua]|uniref:Uncharacterized protein n=1 Tax=Boeremia exigua TaxID=749465 RepID=A0ACC2I791_9PLEO|nr:hypothetical protein OPT61_g6297 [Boeremia exigua]
MASEIRSSSPSLEQRSVEATDSSIDAECRQEEAFVSNTPEASLFKQSGSLFSGKNNTKNGSIYQFGNINANNFHLGGAAANSDVVRETPTTAYEWLFAASFDSKHNKIRRERVKSSGTWLFEKKEYQDWYCSTGTNQVLWLHGKPGAGKTFITSTVIDKILASEEPDVGLAYVYLDYADREAQTLENVFASILKQIALCKEKEGQDEVCRLYRTCMMSAGRPEADVLVDSLRRSLDLPTWKFLLTGRSHLSDVDTVFTECLQIIILAHNDDVERLVLERIQEEADLVELFEDNASLKEHTVSKITDRADEMFLLVTLMLNSIASSTCEDDIEEALEQMPGDLEQSYNKTMKRIKDQDPKKVELSYRILWWLSRARRPLSCEELLHAVAVRDGDFTRNSKRESKPGIMTKACMGLVFVDDAKNFRLVHFSTQEYLRAYFSQSTTRQILREEDSIARACLTILLYDDFEEGPCDSKAAVMTRHKKLPLWSYAAHHWHEHLNRSMSRDLSNLSLKFLRDNSKVRSAEQGKSISARSGSDTGSYWPDPPFLPQHRQFTGLHKACQIGAVNLVQQLLQDSGMDINVTDNVKQTPLTLAILYNHADMVELLLRSEIIDCESRDSSGRTPFLMAVSLNRTDIARQLFAKGVDLGALDSEQCNALDLAAKSHHIGIEMLKFLIEIGLDVNQQSRKNNCPLFVAVQYSRRDMVETLLAHGADPNAANKDGWLPLHVAATKYLDISKALYEAGADINASSQAGCTVLFAAASHGQLEIVQWLLSLGADPLTITNNGRTLLHAAAGRDLETVKAVHKAGVDIAARTESGRTALHMATEYGQLKIVNWLVSLGADPSTGDINGWTPLHCAVKKDLQTAKALHGAGASVHVLSNSRGAVLHEAVTFGQLKIVEWLLSHGADASAVDDVGWTPLHLAVERDLEISQALYQAGASIHTRNKSQSTALHEATERGQLKIVEWLLSLGVEQDAADIWGCTPLYLAVGKDLDISKALHKVGANIYACNSNGMSVLVAAAYAGKPGVVDWLLSVDSQSLFSIEESLCATAASGALDTVESLLSKVADSNAYSEVYEGALHAACMGGHEEVVKMLLVQGAVADQAGGCPGIPLAAAALKGHTDVLRLLVAHNALCVNSVDKLGRNALHLAAKGGHIEAFEFLLSERIELDVTDIKGYTILHQAASGGSLPVIKSLLDRGVTAPAAVSGTWSPLHLAYRAADQGVIDILTTLCSDKEVVETQRPSGLWTPASIGVYHHNKKVGQVIQDTLGVDDPKPKLVGIANIEGDYQGGFTCDECYHDIYGPRFRCVSCFDFDLCFMCKLTAAKSHPLHEWKIFQYKEEEKRGGPHISPITQQHYGIYPIVL